MHPLQCIREKQQGIIKVQLGTSVFWKSEQSCFFFLIIPPPHPPNTVSYWQLIIRAFLLGWSRGKGDCLKRLGLCHNILDAGGEGLRGGYEDETLMSYSSKHDDIRRTWSTADCQGNQLLVPEPPGGRGTDGKLCRIKVKFTGIGCVYVQMHLHEAKER